MSLKKKVIWSTLCLLCVNYYAVAYQGEQESIEDLQNKVVELSGAAKIALLHQLAYKLRYSEVNKALEYAEEAFDLSRAAQNDSLIAESNFCLGQVYIISGDISTAITHYLDAKAGFSELDLPFLEVRALQPLAAAYAAISENEKASQLYFEALELSRGLGDTEGEIHTLTRLGIIQSDLGEYRIDRRFLLDAIHKAEEIDDWGAQTIALAEAGFLEESRGDRLKAVEYYQRAIDIFNEKNVRHAVPSLMFDIARLYRDEEKFDEALKIAEEALQVVESLNNNFLTFHSLDQIAEIYHETGQYQKAVEILEPGIQKAEEVGMLNSSLFLLNKISMSYLAMGDYSNASASAEQARTMALEAKDWATVYSTLETLVEIEKKGRNFERAISFQEELLSVRDSIYDEEKTRSVLEFEARFRVEEKEKEIASLQAQNKQRLVMQAMMAAGLGLMLLIGFLVVRSQRLKIKSSQADLELSHLKRKKLEQDLEFKNKQLTTQSLNMVQKNEMMSELKEKVEQLRKEGSTKELNNLANLVEYSFSLDEDWKQFQMHFEEVHSGFYHILKERYPNLTPNELRLSALVKLNLTIKEMAAILGISPDSVKTARYRLRKKLELNTEDNLTEFMLEIEKESLELS